MFRGITAAVFAMVMAVLMLRLRELILWLGRKKRDHDQAQADAPGASGLEIRKDEDEAVYNDSQSEFVEPAPRVAFLEVEEFLKNHAELEYSISSRR